LFESAKLRTGTDADDLEHATIIFKVWVRLAREAAQRDSRCQSFTISIHFPGPECCHDHTTGVIER
jgi:hypothetical protein